MLGIEWYVIIIGVVFAFGMAVFVFFTARLLWWFIKWLER